MRSSSSSPGRLWRSPPIAWSALSMKRRKPATYEPSDRIITSSRKSRTGSKSHSAGRVISLSLSSVVLGKFVSFGIFDERASQFRVWFKTRVGAWLCVPIEEGRSVAARFAVLQQHERRNTGKNHNQQKCPVHRQKE